MRKYSSTIPALTLNGSLAAGATSATITGGASLPVIASPNVLTLVIEPDTTNEEIVTVTAHSSGSTSVTIVRGQESTSDIAHSSAVAVKHMVTARDLQEPHQHIVSKNYSENGSVELHGLGTSDGDVVGTAKAQTLTNKTISGSSNTLSNIAQANVTNLVSDLAAKAPLASPTFTGTVVLPSTTSIGTISNAELLKLDGLTASTVELNYVTGVTSAIQTQIDARAIAAYASIYRTTGALTADGILTYPNENTDILGFHETVNFPGRITVPAGYAGKYKVSAIVTPYYNGNDATFRAYLRKNGTKVDGTDVAGFANNTYGVTGGNIDTIISLAVADYLEVYVDVTTSGPGIGFYSTFSVEYVGA